MSSLDLVVTRLPAWKDRCFKPKETMLASPNLLWEIQSGVVRTLTWNDDGEVITLGIWGAGDIVGQPLSKVEPYQLECLTPVDAWVLPKDHPCPPETLVNHIQQIEQLCRIVHRKSMKHRLLELLSWLARRFGDPVDGGQLINVRLTHQVLAETIGATRVTITRLLQELEREGRLQRSGQACILRELTHSECHDSTPQTQQTQR